MATWDLSKTKHHILLCNGGSCMQKGGEEVTVAIRQEIARLQADEQIHTTRTKCNGRCEDACVVVIYPDGIWYQNVQPEDAGEIVGKLVQGQYHQDKISHRYRGDGFVRNEKVALGVKK
ncbi:(2Fe-2S) ferredoxin domain-containing protein [Brevibacterium sp. JNUCC-42]|nr:(2Fe-2S) ferredoxin domain-containing protein [Brevibacterium sp. JNUCC-42]